MVATLRLRRSFPYHAANIVDRMIQPTVTKLPPVNSAARPIAGEYRIGFVSVDAFKPLANGATSRRLDYFDNIDDLNGGEQVPNIYLYSKLKFDKDHRQTPLYHQEFYIPSSQRQESRLEGIRDAVLDSGLLKLPRREEFPSSGFRGDAQRGFVEITVAGQDDKGQRSDHFVGRIGRLPQAMQDVMRAAQQLGIDMRRSGAPLPE